MEINEAELDSGREHGVQPLDQIMEHWQLINHQLVDSSTEQLTHKQVHRARQGRQLTLKMMQKVARALNVAIWTRLKPAQREEFFEYMHKHLFNYAKGYDPEFEDPNQQGE